jgi:uncharacterized 2Fe-2S/4Fe-4S cluster protein (DUF4445 family)
MAEVLIKFEPEGIEGIVPVETYLIDAAKRIGVKLESVCVPGEDEHNCFVEIQSGAELLSEPTSFERSRSEEGRDDGAVRRSMCHTKLIGAGELVVMTKKKAKEAETEKQEQETIEKLKKEFEKLPLEKKIANLVHLEAVALGETMTYVANSPFTVAEKIMDVLAEFGFKKEAEEKKAVRPEDHAKVGEPEAATSEVKDASKKAGTTSDME